MPPAIFAKERPKPDPGRPPSGVASPYLKIDLQERLNQVHRPQEDDLQAWVATARRSTDRQGRAASAGSRRPSIQDDHSNCKDCYPEVLDLSSIGGNFQLDWEAMARARADGAPRRIITRGKTYSGIVTDPKSGEPYQPPTMLIPFVKARARSAVGEMFFRVRSPSVMALDSLTPFILASNIQTMRNQRSKSVPPPDDPPVVDASRLDSFAHIYDVYPKKRPRSAQHQDEWSLLEASVKCPQCRHILNHTKYKRFLLEWYKEQLQIYQGSELQLFPRSGNLTKVDKPHFCNFVRKAKLFNRADEVPPPTHSKDHLRRRHDSLDDLTSVNRRHRTRFALRHGLHHRSQELYDGSTDGRQGRPGSPDFVDLARLQMSEGSEFAALGSHGGHGVGDGSVQFGDLSSGLQGGHMTVHFGQGHGGVSSDDVTGGGDQFRGKPPEAWGPSKKGTSTKSNSSSKDGKPPAIVIPRALTAGSAGDGSSGKISDILRKLGSDNKQKSSKGGKETDENDKNNEKGKRRVRNCVHKKEKTTRRRRKTTRSPSPEEDPEVMMDPPDPDPPIVPAEVTPSVQEWNFKVYQRAEIPQSEERTPVVLTVKQQENQERDENRSKARIAAEEKLKRRILPKAEFGRAKADLAERLEESLAKNRQNDSDMGSETGSEMQDSQHELSGEQQSELGGRNAIMQMLYPGLTFKKTKDKDSDKHKDRHQDRHHKDKDRSAFVEPKPKIPPWTFGRLALSQQSSRFELPMDMFELEKMSVQDYLRKHCVVSSHRIALYQRVFIKHKEKGQHITQKELEKALMELLVNRVSQENIRDLYKMVEIEEETKIDFNLFCGVCALSERIFYPQFLEDMKALKRTEETMDLAERQKDKIECADLGSLAWKFHGVNVNPAIKKILETI